MKNSACFCGHRDILTYNTKVQSKICDTILDLYQNHNIVNFLSGGMGNFDAMCETEVLILKQKHPKVKLFLVIPYFTKSINNNPLIKYKYDEIIYPDFQKQYHYKQLILKRNKWLVDNNDYVIANVTKDYGGAYKTLKYAQKTHKEIISLTDI